jgi:hypothetical protein
MSLAFKVSGMEAAQVSYSSRIVKLMNSIFLGGEAAILRRLQNQLELRICNLASLVAGELMRMLGRSSHLTMILICRELSMKVGILRSFWRVRSSHNPKSNLQMIQTGISTSRINLTVFQKHSKNGEKRLIQLQKTTPTAINGIYSC